MSLNGVALLTLLSHYRRRPGQLLMLLLGLWVAGALWSGVQAINASARNNYDQAATLLHSGFSYLTRTDGRTLTRDDFIHLRRTGFLVSPLREGQLVSDTGTKLSVIGIDPLTLPTDSTLARTGGGSTLQEFIASPWQTRLTPDTRLRLGSLPTVNHGSALPPLIDTPGLPPDTLVMDISVASELLGAGSSLSGLIIASDTLAQAPPGYTLISADTRMNPGELTQSFHLNLSAMALLALVVGLFIVQATLGLALEQRLGLLRTLRALGVPGRNLVMVLALELAVLGLIGTLVGLISGLWLAKALLPDVAATLQSLYGANVSDQLSLPWQYWLGSITMVLAGLFVAGSGVLWRASRISPLGLNQAQTWRASFQRQLVYQTLGGGLAAAAALILWLWLTALPSGEGLLISFGLVGCVMLASALWLPPLLSLSLTRLSHLISLASSRTPTRYRPLLQWSLADLQLQLPGLSLALMALLIALSANLGVNSMVGGFRLTFLEWLDQRLPADLYLKPPAAQFDAIESWLTRQDSVAERLTTTEATTRLLKVSSPSDTERVFDLPISVYGITPGDTITSAWPLLATLDDRKSAWKAFQEGDAFINEQLARREQITPGDNVTLDAPDGPKSLHVVGIYPDYGNPRGEVLLTTSLVRQLFRVPPSSIGIVIRPGRPVAPFQRLLSERFDLTSQTLRDQREVKASAKAIFERTFTITRALNGLTLGVAALALLATLLAQAHERRQRLVTLWAIGVPRWQLLTIQLCQLAGASLVTGLLAIPLGIAITVCLVWGINVAAFGWRLPLHLFPVTMALTLSASVLVALLAAVLPMVRLWRSPPQALLAEEST